MKCPHPINIPLQTYTGPVLVHYQPLWARTGPALVLCIMFIGYMQVWGLKVALYQRLKCLFFIAIKTKCDQFGKHFKIYTQ